MSDLQKLHELLGRYASGEITADYVTSLLDADNNITALELIMYINEALSKLAADTLHK